MKADTTSVEVLQLGTPQLCQLGQPGQSAQTVGTLVFNIQIDLLLQFMGVADKWNDVMLDECAELAYAECYWFSLAELKQFTHRVKTGHYTSHKNLTPAVLMEFLQIYSAEMMKARGDYYGKSKVTTWQPPDEQAPDPKDRPVSDAAMAEAMKQLMQALPGSGLSDNEYKRIKHDYNLEQAKKRANGEHEETNV